MKLSFSNVGLLSLLTVGAMTLPTSSAVAQYHSSQSKMVVHSINKTLRSGTSIDLQRAFAQKLQAGEQIKSIRLITRSGSYGSSAYLMKWGNIVDSTSLSGSSKMLSLPQNESMMNMSLKINGSVYVSRIVATVEQSYVDPYGDSGYGQGHQGHQGQSDVELIKANINKHTYGVTKLQVKNMIQQMSGINLNGKEVKKVVIKASSNGYGYQRASVQLEVNGRKVGQAQSLSSRMQNVVMTLSPYQRNIIGEDIQNIKVVVVGNALVRMVGVKVKEELFDYGMGYDNTPDHVVITTQKALFGSQRSILSQLIGYNPSVSFTKTIQKLELVVSGQGSIQLAGAGYQNRSARGAQQGKQSGTITFNLNDGATTVKDLALESDGNLTIKKIKITFNPMY